MKVSGTIASAILLLLASGVTAVPSPKPGLAVRDASGSLAPRAQECNAPKPTEKSALERYERSISTMKSHTRDAHLAQEQCPDSKETEYNNEKNAQKKGLIKQNCINSWKRAKSSREKANQVCSNLGGTIDQGHLQAVTTCENKVKHWESK